MQATTDSGKELFQGLLTDETRTFSDRSRVRLVIGNAGAVSLTVNGTAVGSPGRPGQVARVQFTPHGSRSGLSRGPVRVTRLPPMSSAPQGRRVALVTLGCARNEVDSEELAGRLAADGWQLVADAGDADVAVVNTCGFVEAAKKDSIDTVLQAADLKGGGRTQAVVAVGCLAERYGDAARRGAARGRRRARLRRLRRHLRAAARRPGRRAARPPRPARPAARCCRWRPSTGRPPGSPPGPAATCRPGSRPASGPRTDAHAPRRRSGRAAEARVGLRPALHVLRDPGFRGSFVSRRPSDVLAEAAWLAEQGVRELVLVSENSTSYGKDLGDLRLLETLLPELAAVDGVDRVRVSYLQPAEMRPGLVEVMTSTEGVAPYFDLSFQHASGPVLRRMRRFGDTDRFLELVEQHPRAGRPARACGPTSSSASPARPRPTSPSWSAS